MRCSSARATSQPSASQVVITSALIVFRGECEFGQMEYIVTISLRHNLKMFRTHLVCPVIVLLAPLLGLSQTNNSAADAEIQALKQRVAELEQQNRTILAALQAIQSKMGITTAVAAHARASFGCSGDCCTASSGCSYLARTASCPLGGTGSGRIQQIEILWAASA